MANNEKGNGETEGQADKKKQYLEDCASLTSLKNYTSMMKVYLLELSLISFTLVT